MKGKPIQSGDYMILVPEPGVPMEGLVLDVSPTMSLPGGPPQGMRKVKVAMMLEIMAPDHVGFQRGYVLHKGDAKESQDLSDTMKKLLEGMRVGSGGSPIVLG